MVHNMVREGHEPPKGRGSGGFKIAQEASGGPRRLQEPHMAPRWPQGPKTARVLSRPQESSERRHKSAPRGKHH